jgi:hypothetical protein
MAPSLNKVEALLGALETKGVEYTINDSTITATVADAPFVVAQLDEAAGTFTFTALRPPKSSSRSGKMPTFEAGGIHNAAKRGALIGRKPSQNSVKDALAEALTADGWTRAR